MKKYWPRFLSFIKKPENVFISLSLFFGVLSAATVPLLSVNDEGVHYMRAYGLSQGKIESGVACTLPKEVVLKAKEADVNNFVTSYKKIINRSDTETGKCSSATGYPPIMHLPQTIGIMFANLVHGSLGITIIFGRLANVIFYSFTLYFIIKWVRVGKWAFVATSLFPLMIHLAASLSGDSMTNIAIFTAIAATLNFFSQKSPLTRQQQLLIIAIACLLILTKSVTILLLSPVIFLPKRLFVPDKKSKKSFIPQKWLVLSAAAILAGLCLIAWLHVYTQPLLTTGAPHNPLHSNPLKFIQILFNTYLNPNLPVSDDILRGVIGAFSAFKYGLPLFILLPSFSLLFLSLLHYNKKDQELLGEQTGKLAVYNLATIGLFVCAVSYAMYTAWALLPFRFGEGAYYADGVQGRYFTATAVMLVPVGLWLQKYINVRTKNEKVFNLIMFFGLALVLGFYVFETVWTYK